MDYVVLFIGVWISFAYLAALISRLRVKVAAIETYLHIAVIDGTAIHVPKWFGHNPPDEGVDIRRSPWVKETADK